jgi:hypothetical protein
MKIDRLIDDNQGRYSNGYVERLHRTLLDAHFRIMGRTRFYESVDEMQPDLDAYLVSYNTERPHPGYRNMGRRSVETVMSFVS